MRAVEIVICGLHSSAEWLICWRSNKNLKIPQMHKFKLSWSTKTFTVYSKLFFYLLYVLGPACGWIFVPFEIETLTICCCCCALWHESSTSSCVMLCLARAAIWNYFSSEYFLVVLVCKLCVSQLTSIALARRDERSSEEWKFPRVRKCH